MSTRALVVLAIGLGTGSVGGCAGGRPDADQLPEGLTMFEADPVRGLGGAYVVGGHAVYFETRRGAALDDVYQEPGDPVAYATDLRFLDAEGRVFYRQAAGDGFMDPSWGEAPEGLEAVDPAVRVLDWQAASEVGAGMAAFDELAALPEVAQLDAVAAITRDVLAAPVIAPAPVGAETPYTHVIHQIQVFKKLESHEASCAWISHAVDCAPEYGLKCCSGGFGTGGIFSYLCDAGADCDNCVHRSVPKYHSATLTWSYNTNTDNWVNYTAPVMGDGKCNHGACPGASGMSRKCAKNYANRASTETAVTQWCASDYHLLSYGNAHNCHDDSTLQVRNVEANSWGHTGACSDNKCHLFAPDCNGDFE